MNGNSSSCLMDHKLIVSAINLPMVVVTVENIICYFNSAAERLTGWKSIDVVGEKYNKARFFSEDSDAAVTTNYGIKSVLQNGIPATWKGFIVRKNGQRIPVESHISPVRDQESQAVIGAVNIMHDISVLAGLEQTLKDILLSSRLDHLCGVNNRQAIDGIIESEIERASRYSQPLAVIMLDLDDFKKINDNYGHETGDLVLREVGSMLNFNLRLPDSVGRWGGEEFLIVLPGSTLDTGRQTGQRLCEYIANLEIRGLERPVTASLGVAIHKPGITAGDLINNADKAMYQAKQKGKNQVCVYD
ncbi:MAG: GGDEF domain-containing protein [Sedimentisphaerales bacterium]|nr:GGDEF domain-containing protein [Sedimentisphaerales bacterium]MBN2841997.1 GGDEF domain-containing protein [Sedimentisphaerales bacterium]